MSKKPEASWREEPWWHWDWPGRPGQSLQQGAGVHDVAGAEPISQRSWKYLYVPDPESPNGWRQTVVYPDLPPSPDQRRLGFK